MKTVFGVYVLGRKEIREIRKRKIDEVRTLKKM